MSEPRTALTEALETTKDKWFGGDRDSWWLAEPEGMAADILSSLAAKGWTLAEAADREGLERQSLEAAAIRQAVIELQRERGRLSKVTHADFLSVLGAVHNLSDEALRAALGVPARLSSEAEGKEP